MIIVDAQLSPHLALWINKEFGLESFSVGHLGLLQASDRDIFDFGRQKNAIILTKDSDFILLLEKNGPPPKVIWVTCGNTSNERMKRILQDNLYAALDLLKSERLVEFSD